MRLLFLEHGGHLSLGCSVDASVGPIALPPVEILLCLGKAFESQSPYLVLARFDCSLYLAFAIRMAHASGQRGWPRMACC